MVALAHVRWVREWRRPDGGPGFRLGREGNLLVAEWEGCGTLRASPLGQAVEVTPAPHFHGKREEKWRQGPVNALLRHLAGRPTLHGSAVAIDGGALVFLGDSGAGKSTCAAALCARSHAALLADDLAELDLVDGRLYVGASDTGCWLHPDSARVLGGDPASSEKQRVDASRVSTARRPLKMLVTLAFTEAPDPVATPVRGNEAFEVLNAAYVRFIVDDVDVHLRDLEILSTIAAAVPVLRVSRPRSLEALDRTTALVGELARGGSR